MTWPSVTRFLRPAGVVLAASVTPGCAGPRHMLDPTGPQAAEIARLWWIMLAVGGIVLVLVLAAAFASVRRRSDATDDLHPVDPRATLGDGRRRSIVMAAAGGTAAVLVAMVVLSVETGQRLAALGRDDALTIEVVGHQWWWEIRYPDTQANRTVVTANELHIPVGEPVKLKLSSRDVIHSFWVPNLHGKVDLIPGRENTLWIQADEAGTWEGFCAEFCGMQHTNMRITLVAQHRDAFDAWAEHQRQPAQHPPDSLAAEGRRVFEQTTCAMCHTVRGTAALGKVAPDLTHIAGRLTLGAGSMPNTRGHLAGWILDPQAQKPGNRMPATALQPDELRALLHWLETLR